MSHFVVLALLDKVNDFDDANQQVSDLLEQYDENLQYDGNLQVEGYEQDCNCAGHIANVECDKVCEEKYPIDVIRQEHRLYCASANLEPYSKEWDKKWDLLIKDRKEMYEKLLSEHPLKDYPDKECSDCHGTGIYTSRYNPNSHWDWWTIGGRWTGYLNKNYDPTTDPDNIETCFICGGTGDREKPEAENSNPWVTYVHKESEEILTPSQFRLLNITDEEKNNYIRTFRDDWAKKLNGCNGCHGKGVRVKFCLTPKTEFDIVPVSSLPFDDEEAMKSLVPYAIITSDGEWHGKGSMGWFGLSSDENPEWETVAIDLLQKNKDKMLVVVDCHI